MLKQKKVRKIFKFLDGGAARLSRDQRSVRAEKMKDPKDLPPFFIRGIKAGSKEEYWVSLALEKIEQETGWGWEYQVSVYGGRSRAHGQVVDFLMYTPGMTSCIDVMGRYWHTGRNEDRSDMLEVARRKHWKLIQFFTDETPTKEIMLTFLRNKLNA